MIYSNFYKKWIATCMKCKLAVLHYNTTAGKYKIKRVVERQSYDFKFLKEYFIIDSDMYEVRDCCGKSFNKNCKTYMKNQ